MELKEVVLASWVLPDSPSSGGPEFAAMYSTVLPSLQGGHPAIREIPGSMAQQWVGKKMDSKSEASGFLKIPWELCVFEVEPSSLPNSTFSQWSYSMETSRVKSAGVSTPLGGLISHRGEWDSICWEFVCQKKRMSLYPQRLKAAKSSSTSLLLMTKSEVRLFQEN